ncbi:hypothetical protein D3C81_2329970 [compost metagenome]
MSISYVPLHEQAAATAKEVRPVEVADGKGKSKYIHAYANIEKALDKGQKIGFKRRHVRC